jgi:hypothetical protein
VVGPKRIDGVKLGFKGGGVALIGHCGEARVFFLNE